MTTVSQELIATVERVTPMLDAIAADQNLATRSDRRKWSRREILRHIVDAACKNHRTFVRMMQHASLDFPGYRQDDWVAVQARANARWKGMVHLRAAYNRPSPP